eukprot:31284-Pelagococcus_subviridis.AAC.6
MDATRPTAWHPRRSTARRASRWRRRPRAGVERARRAPRDVLCGVGRKARALTRRADGRSSAGFRVS